MSSRVIVEFQAKPGSGDDLKNALRAALPDTRKYSGYRNIEVLENQDKAGNVVLVEEWESRPHYEKYLAWRQETGLLDKLGPLLAGPPSIRHLDVIDM